MNNLIYNYKNANKSNKINKKKEKMDLLKKKLFETNNKDISRYNYLNKQISQVNDKDNLFKIEDKIEYKNIDAHELNIDSNNTIFSINTNTINFTLCNNMNISTYDEDELDDINRQNVNSVQNKNKTKQYTISDIKSKNIITINNVFQPKYKNNKYSKGLGDFIRGCFFLLEFCERYNFKLNIMFNTIHDFLDNTNTDTDTDTDADTDSNTDLYNNISDNIVFLEFSNWLGGYADKNDIIIPVLGKNYINNFINSIINTPVYDSNIYICCTIYSPVEIQPKHIQVMQQHLKPNKEISDLIDETLINLKLIKNNYIVIHIRSGDKYLIDKENNINNHFVKKIISEMNQIINSNTKDTNYLLISDSIMLKRYLIHIFPFCKTIFLEITHFGEGVEIDKVKLKNTLIEFYLMSKSKRICAFSIYDHGTGFSQWVAITYNIPYSCKLCS
jgi:hypothetical protein